MPCDWDESYDESFVYKAEGYVASDHLFSTGNTIKEIDIAHLMDKLERDLDSVKCNFVKFLVSHTEVYEIKSASASGYDPMSGRGIKLQNVDYSKYDAVITYPPFSLFREFIDVMFKNNIVYLCFFLLFESYIICTGGILDSFSALPQIPFHFYMLQYFGNTCDVMATSLHLFCQHKTSELARVFWTLSFGKSKISSLLLCPIVIGL